MQDYKKIYIFGYSGHSYVVIDSILACGYEILGYFDVVEANQNPYGIKYMGCENQVNLNEIVKNDFVFPTVGEGKIRKKIIQLFEAYKLKQFTLIDPSALVSPMSSIGHSTYIGKKACVNSLSVIGDGVIVNTAAIIEHECKVNHYSHIAPQATLLGNVTVGQSTFFGAGAVAKQNITIGNNTTIGAGTVILNSTKDNEIWVGVPGRKLMK